MFLFFLLVVRRFYLQFKCLLHQINLAAHFLLILWPVAAALNQLFTKMREQFISSFGLIVTYTTHNGQLYGLNVTAF